ncbi:MAG: amidohydrolase family protein [Candidatus Binatia bacterium]
MESAVKLVDADGHVLEPMTLWDRFLSPAAKQFKPQVVRNDWGLDTVFVDSQEIVTAPLGLLGTPGSRMDETDPAKKIPWEQAQPGGFDPRRRLADMDMEGIDVAVLYPSLGLNFWAVENPVAAVALARAYNDWLAEYCAADRRRLVGAAMLPFQDAGAAATELRRAVNDLGFHAAFVRPNPCCGRHIGDPAFEPVWAAAEELGVTIGVHEGSSNTIPTLGTDRYFNPLLLHAMSHAFEQMLACGTLIVTGVMERHPDLHFAFLEAGGGWGPYWLWRLDEQVRGFGRYASEMKLMPSEYFQRQCWIAFEADEDAMPALLPFLGEARVVWGSDYPHHDATFPGAVKKLETLIRPLPAAARDRILHANACALYRLAPNGATRAQS